MPSRGLGIVALANKDSSHTLHDQVVNRIIEDVLGLERLPDDGFTDSVTQVLNTGWSGYSMNARAESSVTVPKEDALLNSLHMYAGTYTNPGYGNITLCASSHDSPHCTEVFAKFAAVADIRNDTLYAAWLRVWISHLRLQHQKDHLFAARGSTLFPNGYGMDRSPFEIRFNATLEDVPDTVQFVMDSREEVVGFALIHNRDAVDVDIAEAWFTKSA